MVEIDDEDETCEFELNVVLEIENTKRPSTPLPSEGSIRLKKVDKDDSTKVLQGAKFDVIDSNGEVVAILTTDSDGIAELDELSLGKYRIVETKAPEGYKLDSTEYEVTLETKAQTVSITIENDEEVIEPGPKDPEEPEEPEEPEDPEEPEESDKPGGGGGGGGGRRKPKDPDPKEPEDPKSQKNQNQKSQNKKTQKSQ